MIGADYIYQPYADRIMAQQQQLSYAAESQAASYPYFDKFFQFGRPGYGLPGTNGVAPIYASNMGFSSMPQITPYTFTPMATYQNAAGGGFATPRIDALGNMGNTLLSLIAQLGVGLASRASNTAPYGGLSTFSPVDVAQSMYNQKQLFRSIGIGDPNNETFLKEAKELRELETKRNIQMLTSIRMAGLSETDKQDKKKVAAVERESSDAATEYTNWLYSGDISAGLSRSILSGIGLDNIFMPTYALGSKIFEAARAMPGGTEPFNIDPQAVGVMTKIGRAHV